MSMLAVSELSCVRGDFCLFEGVGFELAAGELLYLHGPNGSGKTSLLRQLCGLLPAAEGQIRWAGQPIAELGEGYRRVLRFLGHHHAIKEELTPLENLQAFSMLAGDRPDEVAARSALELLGLAGREALACRYLSQGQKRRVALAGLINERRPLWLLDEPFVALDRAAVDLIAGVIGAHLARGGLCVLTTHQPVNIAANAVRQLVLGSC